jgi:glycosyltransferase involved in cell wall biosynthesis
MNVVMVLPYVKAGGTERQASYIANHLQDHGHRVTTISLESNNSFEQLFKVPLIYLNSKHSFSRLFTNLYLLTRQVNHLDAEVIVSRAWNTNLITILTSVLSRKPAVLFLSGSIDLSGKSFFKRMIHSMMLKKASKIISVSEQSKSNCMKWLDIPESKIKVIHNGVDAEMAARLAKEHFELPAVVDREKKNVIFVGRLIHRKGLDVLLKAFSKVINSGKIVNLIVVGEGESEEEYRYLVKHLGIEPHVFFAGEKKNPFPYIKYGDIFVMPSRSEGFPNVLLEAMALKKAVIASDCETGPREVINGKNGTLVPIEDPEKLSQKMVEYLDSREMRKIHGERAQKTVKDRFNLSIQMQKVEAELSSVRPNIK